MLIDSEAGLFSFRGRLPLNPARVRCQAIRLQFLEGCFGTIDLEETSLSGGMISSAESLRGASPRFGCLFQSILRCCGRFEQNQKLMRDPCYIIGR